MKPFQASQLILSKHLRDPQHHPAPQGVEERRLNIYRELFYRNIESFIANGFPVLRAITEDTHWHAMVRDFFARHHCQSPYFLDIAEEFLNYLQHERGAVAGDPPFMLELSHYEWMELVMDVTDADVDTTALQHPGNLRDELPVLTPCLQLLSYQYPVHQIGPDFQPLEPPQNPTFLVVYRDAQDQVNFLGLNPLTARLIELLDEPLNKPVETSKSGLDILDRLAQESQHPEPAQLIDYGLALLEEWQDKGIILGSR